MATPRTEFLAGVRAEAPILLGVAPFGTIYGALAVAAGLPDAAAQAMSSIVFAGSAQFIATQLFLAGAPVLVLLLTTFVVNLRHMLYSASVAPLLHDLPWRWKWLLAYLLTDEAYAVAIMRYRDGARSKPANARPDPPGVKTRWLNRWKPAASRFSTSAGPDQSVDFSSQQQHAASAPDARHWYFLGAGLALWVCWQLSTAAGIFLGSQVPPGWSLDFTLALTFIALLIPAITDRPALAAALSAGVVGVIGATWPYKIGLVVAALTGIAVGIAFDRRATRKHGAAARPPEGEA